MSHLFMEAQAHWPEIAAALLFILSEYLGQNPNSKADNVIQLLVPTLRKAAQPELDKLSGK